MQFRGLRLNLTIKIPLVYPQSLLPQLFEELDVAPHLNQTSHLLTTLLLKFALRLQGQCTPLIERHDVLANQPQSRAVGLFMAGGGSTAGQRLLLHRRGVTGQKRFLLQGPL